MDPDCDSYPEFLGRFGPDPIDQNCDGSVNSNDGCGIHGPEGTFGTPFNEAAGGVFATEWLERKISIWFFRHGEEPADLLAGTPDPKTWTQTPYAAFPLEANCASTHFQDMQIVFDLTFCGAFAGNTYTPQCMAANREALCKDAQLTGATSMCYTAIQAARARLSSGTAPPEYGGCLSADSTNDEIQAVLYVNREGNCIRPCGIDMIHTCTPGDAAAVMCSDIDQDAVLAAANGGVDACNKNIDWVIIHGLVEHPEWYDTSGLTATSDRRAVQAWLFHLGDGGAGGCMKPCDLTGLDLPFDPGPGRLRNRPPLQPPSDSVGMCNEQTLYNPESFKDAFWAVNSIKVYQPVGRVETCDDGEMGSGEAGIDCGGPCPPCKGSQTQTCGTPVPGNACYANVQWALEHGLPEHPEWYAGSCLTGESDPSAVQAWFYSRMPQEQCPRPCGDLSALDLCFEPTVGGTNCGSCDAGGGGH
jgi:hypothetical protein